ncbi:alanine racemase [Roseibium suaedae]|uniref:D-serine dehydratase n=1 Tax=Roseibium suaedae TaxID=735517 RepID=A0A1M7NU87_9HYPH|nr:alanine racemase [Roseibium suaedae]SHN07599.1 D-serine dehydratase [Roseibium suaedae]
MSFLRGLVGVIGAGDDLASKGLHPERGDLSLPALTLDLAAFDKNAEAMFAYAKARNLLLAPHAKTPMSPELSRRLADQGAWGLSVANLQQAMVLLNSGFSRLLVANQIGGEVSGVRFGKLLAAHPEAEVIFFIDSIASAKAIVAAAKACGRTLPVLIEIGSGRAGARDEAAITALIDEVLAKDCLELSGIACYEGAAAKADPAETEAAIAELCDLSLQAFAKIRKARPEAELLLSAGGSSFFDLVVRHLLPAVEADGNARMVLRSGAIFFHDHGVYERALAQLDQRNGFEPVTGQKASEAFTPALRVWAEVLSRPEPDLLICGMGMRDVSFDQDMPRPLAFYRNGNHLEDGKGASVFKLNDQHAFLRVDPSHPAEVGDVVEFGISHPCTCIDRWRSILGRGPDGAILASFPTYFG